MNKRTIKRMFAAMMCAVMLLTCAPLNGLGTKSYAATNIPSDAVVYNGHSYKVYSDSMTWSEASSMCISNGGHLVTITSIEENEFLAGLVATGSKSTYWIGLTDSKDEGSFCWVTDEKFSFSAWDEGQPDNNTDNVDEDYVEVFLKKGKLVWNDNRNDGALKRPIEHTLSYHGYICEWEPEKADATLNYNNSIKLEPKTKLVEGEKYTITWKTSDSNIATVDNDGTVTAVKRGSGTVTITCIIIDSHGNTFVDTFIIVVKLSLIQWIIIFILFGWLWY